MSKKPTGRIENFNGIPLNIPNDIISEQKTFYISYISYNNRDHITYGSDTTALVREKKGKPTKFLILNGDHSEAYNKIITNGGGYKECVMYFENNIQDKNKHSENADEQIKFTQEKGLHVVKCNKYE